MKRLLAALLLLATAANAGPARIEKAVNITAAGNPLGMYPVIPYSSIDPTGHYMKLEGPAVSGLGLYITLGTLAQYVGGQITNIPITAVGPLGANTVAGNASASPHNGVSLTVPSCSTSASAVQWVTNSGWTCNTSIVASSATTATTATTATSATTATTAAGLTASSDAYATKDTAAKSVIGPWGFIASGVVNNTTPTTTDGLVIDYSTGTGRFSVFAGDGFGWYNGSTVASTSLMTLSSVGVLALTNTLNLDPGTTTTAPVVFATGTNLTAPAAGAMEYDGTVFYATPNASNRAVNVAQNFVSLSSGRTFTANTSAQAIFAGGGGPATGALTLPVGTYYFECMVSLSSLSSSAHTLSFGMGGTATTATPLVSMSFSDGGTSYGLFTTFSVTVGSTGTTGTTGIFKLSGTFRVSVAGTIIPQLTQTGTGAAAVANIDSYFWVYQVGGSGATYVGNWN